MLHSIKLFTQTETEIPVSDLLLYSNSVYSLKPFDELTIDFFDTFSKKILSDLSINKIPGIVALGFWMRKNNINTIKVENSRFFESANYQVRPLGKVFHISPANVDTMFIYSLAVSLLMGNKNIVRISNRMNSDHIKWLFHLLNDILRNKKFQILNDYINIISYDHNEEISTMLSQTCNARIIWGGDNTIGIFKKIKTAPRTKDIIFADRISSLCVNCESYLKLDEKEMNDFAKRFFNDAYTFDQMGCSSPQTIYFIGSESAFESCTFKMLNHLKDYVSSKYETDIFSLASLKINRTVDDALENTIIRRTGNNYITFLESLNNDDKMVHGCGGGYFYTKKISNLTELTFLNQPKVQTISYFGLTSSEKIQLIDLSGGEGIDRIVPLGQALNFHYIWDGYNLLDELSKKVYIQ